MRHSIWYRTEERQPVTSGYYLTYRGWGMGGKVDGDSDNSYLYYYRKTDKWYEYESEVRSMHPRTCIVYYWTDADPAGWTDADPPSVKIKRGMQQEHVAVQEAWQEVEEALKRYETVRALCQK